MMKKAKKNNAFFFLAFYLFYDILLLESGVYNEMGWMD